MDLKYELIAGLLHLLCGSSTQIVMKVQASSRLSTLPVNTFMFVRRQLVDRAPYILAASATTYTSARCISASRYARPSMAKVRAICPANVVLHRTISTARTSRPHARFITVATSVLVRAAGRMPPGQYALPAILVNSLDFLFSLQLLHNALRCIQFS